MRNYYKLFGFICSFLFIAQAANAQFWYDEHSIVEGVKINYKWSDPGWLSKSTSYELRLKLKNENKHAVNVDFRIDFYLNGLLQETSKIEDFCISPRGMASGRLDGLYFTSLELTDEQLKSEVFTWEINDFTVDEVERCK